MKKVKMMKKYAWLIASIGINANSKQDVIISAPVEAYKFVRYLTMALYANKARSVEVEYTDTNITKQQLMNLPVSKLSKVAPWIVEKEKYRVENNYVRITLVGDDPCVYKNVNSSKLQARQKALIENLQVYKKDYHNNRLAWCIAAVATPSWAKRLFPELSPTQGMIKLWNLIYQACRINEDDDPESNWDEHVKTMQKHADILNEYQFKKLHYTNSKGTDLYVGLVKNHLWQSAKAIQGFNSQPFIPNIPTEEVFTMPDRNDVNGVVYSSKPLSNNGVLIEDFMIEFKDGKVINYSAKENQEQLKSIIECDEGSHHLGEAALVSYHSPISLQNVIYQETLFDENASCHLALGQSFVENIENGLELSEEQLLEKGANQSKMHVDFMIGTSDLNIDGIKEDGTVVPVFRNGDFVF